MEINYMILLQFVFLLIHQVIGAPNTSIVEISSGKIQGTVLTSRNGKTYYAFKGIPYGHAERFEVAKPVESWNGIRNASEFGAECFQMEPLIAKSIIGSEDCLFLNIYSSKVLDTNPRNNELLPVLIWLHGGGFSSGTGNAYKAEYFMDSDSDVILVTLNYRLSVFGFLDTQDGVIEGNLGLKDQRLALQFVKLNIQKFGGDIEKITIFGNSAGGSSVAIHMLTDSEGLFNRAISQSSDALSGWLIQRRPRQNAIELAKLTKCTSISSIELKSCLQTKTPHEILTAVSKFKVGHPIYNLYFMFTPSIENSSLNNTLLNECPLKLLQDGQGRKDVPWLTGFCKNDGIFNIGPQNQEIIDEVYSKWNEIAPWQLVYKYSADDEKIDEISNKIKNRLTDNNGLDRNTFWAKVSELVADRWGITGTIQSINLWRKRASVYPYIFSYMGNFSFVNHFWKLKSRHGIGHLDELPYLFPGIYGSPEFGNETEIGKFSQQFVNLWTSFARDGKPADEQLWPQLLKMAL